MSLLYKISWNTEEYKMVINLLLKIVPKYTYTMQIILHGINVTDAL